MNEANYVLRLLSVIYGRKKCAKTTSIILGTDCLRKPFKDALMMSTPNDLSHKHFKAIVAYAQLDLFGFGARQTSFGRFYGNQLTHIRNRVSALWSVVHRACFILNSDQKCI